MDKRYHRCLHINRLFCQAVESYCTLPWLPCKMTNWDMELSLRPQDMTCVKLEPILLYRFTLYRIHGANCLQANTALRVNVLGADEGIDVFSK